MSARDHSCHMRCPRDPNFFRSLFLSGLDYGLSSLRRACYLLIWPFLIPVDSPGDQREGGGSKNRGLGFVIRADFGRFRVRMVPIRWFWRCSKREVGLDYFRGTYMLERDAPMPGVPWTTFWLVIANSPRKCPIISGLISIATNSLPECKCKVKPSISGIMIISLACVLTGTAFPPPFPFSRRDWRICSRRLRWSLVRPLTIDLR